MLYTDQDYQEEIVEVLEPEVKKSNHRANIVRINEVLPHPNADRLELIHIGGYQVVVQKDTFKAGDLGVYIQPDSVVPQTEPFKFIWEPYVTEDGTVPERRRRITVRKFRKEYSEGLLLPILTFDAEFRKHAVSTNWAEISCTLAEGDDVSDILGITHYQPYDPESTGGSNEKAPRLPRTLKGWFYWVLRKLGFNVGGQTYGDNEGGPVIPVYDVEAYKNYVNAFEIGETVVITEKIHGSNGRFYYDAKKQKLYVGSRKFWKSAKSKCVWRKVLEQHPWIELFCKSHPGFALYGEVVPTQPNFTYGCRPGETNFFVFDILKPDGTWLAWDDSAAFDLRRQVNWVPVVGAGVMAGDITLLAEGMSMVKDADHVREGVVIKPTTERHVIGLGRLMLKVVSNTFLERY